MTSVANAVAMTTLAVHTLQLHFCTGWLKELASEVKTYRTRNPLPYGIIGRVQSLPGSYLFVSPGEEQKSLYRVCHSDTLDFTRNSLSGTARQS